MDLNEYGELQNELERETNEILNLQKTLANQAEQFNLMNKTTIELIDENEKLRHHLHQQLEQKNKMNQKIQLLTKQLKDVNNNQHTKNNLNSLNKNKISTAVPLRTTVDTLNI